MLFTNKHIFIISDRDIFFHLYADALVNKCNVNPNQIIAVIYKLGGISTLVKHQSYQYIEYEKELLKPTCNTVKIVYKELPVDDPKQRQPDITKARTILGWEPKVDRAEGLKLTYDYFKALPPSEWTKSPKEFISK